ncbi:D-3-phosphoglycerate dehydrogenase [Anaerosphaera aminiphila DSM 21120]|uniref:D-3-phosphoglycerate dehydrogenase n=1 Tax=Anaerosphaera aminiphila DSM 21120 TaxID=1120995 RepID=A0A1M5QLE1_9FIRM|nr:NAD(P)-dependent oxidoreductase [Anaerosphaera aminiphila]SHH14550.1 D-3-phosphoglycerate dehydrogenase [Anaerosphaera aminiphila DSM 21120]
MKILANDGLAKNAEEHFIDEGIEIETNHFDKEELMKVGGDYDVIVVRSNTKIDKDVAKALKGTKTALVIRAGVGLDNIDINACKDCGIDVDYTPNSSKNAVTELVLGQMLNLSRHLSVADATMKKGQWNKKQYDGFEIAGKTLGIIGFGRIGQSLGEKAIALGLEVIYYDLIKVENDYAKYYEFDDLIKKADYISIHLPSLDEPIIGKKELDNMKESAILINYARGNALDEEELIDALKNNRIRGAAIDVFPNEPKVNEKYFELDNVALTPHIGASTLEAQKNIGNEIINIVDNYFGVKA